MSNPTFKSIIYEKDSETGVVEITLNRPEIKNALAIGLLIELQDAVEMANKDDTIIKY